MKEKTFENLNSKKLGVLGEKIAEKYLRKKGYQILDRNYTFRIPGGFQKGEIDIVARKRRSIFDIFKSQKEAVHFIEVKTLSSQKENFLPEEKVDFKKQKGLINTAKSWLLKKKISLESKWQIDIISIRVDFSQKKAKIRHFQNAVF